MQDNVTPQAEKGAAAQDKLKDSVDKTTQSAESQNIQFIKTVASLMAVSRGIHGVVSSLDTLGLTTAKQNAALMKMAAGMQLFVSAAMALKGVIGLINALKTAEIGLAAVETYRSVLKNPAMLAVVGVGLAAAGGFAGYMYASSRDSGGGGKTVNQNITFNGQSSASSQRGAARSSLEIMGG